MQASAMPLNLPSGLLQALGDLNILPDGPPDAAGGDFWKRLAAQLEQLEEVAGALPQEMDADHLAAWLAAGLGGDGLPEAGKDLPLPPGLTPDGAEGSEGDAAAFHPGHLLAAAVHAAASGDRAAAATPFSDGPETFKRIGLELAALNARLAETRLAAQPQGAVLPADAMRGFPELAGLDARMTELSLMGQMPGTAASAVASERGPLELAALNARMAEAAPQAGQAPAAALTAAESGTASISTPTSTSPSANPAGPRLFNLDVPLHQPGWDRALGSQVRWMANQGVQVAELRLSPPNLGPLEVRLQVDGDRTHINILAPHAATREAVEAALPRLREMFAESGMNLGDVNVREENTGRGGSGHEGEAQHAGAGADSDDAEAKPGATRESGASLSQGLVDYYA
ncbi:flagellar hook-length control protein FliK [Thioalkalivibrio sp.]|uniref:flagellar hook-length control protein FliK n=1 Tax=Thioalkalivibrio sp. TaxID=2093813 RepID=UPI0025E2C742|nr:flagellar hook-length control protein FliK [Thioalkalivibrio sp.]